jgi:starch synthase
VSRRNARRLRWVLVAPEAAPYGGRDELALAAGELAGRLHDRGWEVELVLPDGPGPRASELARGHARREALAIDLGGETLRGDLWRCEELFAPGAADEPAQLDRRLGFLARAALEAARRGERPADVLHLFGPRAALAAALLDASPPPELASTRCVFSFVDLEDDVLLERAAVDRLGLPPGLLQPQLAEHHGRLSLLKTGLVFADALVAASPRYAREAATPAAGHGFEALLAERGDDLVGIASGVDSSWDPARDPELAAAFTPERLASRARCRAALQAELGLGKSARSPVCAFVAELSGRRGFDLLLDALPDLLAAGAQIVVAGRGEPALEQRALQAAREHPLHVAAVLGEDEGLERRILAGADLFLAPYRSAPSALGVARAMRYGALPVAHAVGALSDLVKPARERGAEAGGGVASGFLFRTASVAALARAVGKAAAALRDVKTAAGLRRAAMETPLGWAGAVRRYEDLVGGLAKREPRRVAIPAPPPPPEAPAPPAAEPYIDWGPPLPERYGEDALALLVQGPRSVYAYWELAPERYARAGGAPTLGLRVEGGRQIASGLGDFGEYWFDAEPGARLAVELVDAAGRVLLRSAPAETPRDTPSPLSAVREVSRDRRRRGEIASAAAEPVPQPLYHYAADGPVTRFGPNAWQELAAHPAPAEGPAGGLAAAPPRGAPAAGTAGTSSALGGSSSGGVAPAGSSDVAARRDAP